MKKNIYFILIVLILGACTLNANQEAILTTATNDFLKARKQGMQLAYISMIHPSLVRAYKDQGDSVFLKKFEIKSVDNYLDEPILRTIKSKNSSIHALYEFRVIQSGWSEEKFTQKNTSYVAISEDDGRTWFYMPKEDYDNKDIAKDVIRLLNK